MRDLSDNPFLRDSAAPWKYDFVYLCRWLEARAPKGKGLGEAEYPGHEIFRLGQSPSTTFAPREIHSMQCKAGRLHIQVLSLGLFGSNGPLPLHLTEDAHTRHIQQRDPTLIDFLNIFHHRWLSLLYRAWAQAQSAASLDRPEVEQFSGYIAALEGYGPHELAAQPLPPHARLAASSFLVMRSRNPAGLAVTLTHYFGVHIWVEEFCFHWLVLEAEDRSQLTQRGRPCRLGHDAVLGDHVPDRQSSFTLHMGPLHLEEYIRFLPSGDSLHALVAWVRAFVGVEMQWTANLTLHTASLPQCRLGDACRLGRTTWLMRRPSAAHVDPRAPAPVVQGKHFSPDNESARRKGSRP